MSTQTNSTLAFVFPGQGSQSISMLSGLASAFPEVRACFDEASSVLGLDLWGMTQEGPEAELSRTVNTQPAMLAAGVAVWRVWQAKGGARPAFMAGHSLGEYTALVCSGALSFTDAIRLVALRGRLMQDAVPEGQGAMSAILGMEDDDVRRLCADAAEGEVLEAVNFNSPGQVVIAGSRSAVERANALASERGAKRALLLPVSVPSHCALMKDAAEQMKAELAKVEFAMPAIPVFHNVDARPAADVAAVREALYHQLYSAVRWVDTVQNIRDAGGATVVEAGPGKVLAGLCKRIDKALECLPVLDEASLDKALAALA